MYRLQIHLRSTLGDPISKFLHLTDGSISIKQLLYDASDRVQSVYPGNSCLNIVGVQDARACDLDPSFLVNQVLSDFDEVHLFVTNTLKAGSKRVLNPQDSPVKRKKAGVGNETPTNVVDEGSLVQETPTPAARKPNSSIADKQPKQKDPKGAKGAKKAPNDTKKDSKKRNSPAKNTPKSTPKTTATTSSPSKGSLTTAQLLLAEKAEAGQGSMPPPVLNVIEETPEKNSTKPETPAERVTPAPTPAKAKPKAKPESSSPAVEPPTQANESDSTDKAETKESDLEDFTTATESSEGEAPTPVKAVEMPKSVKQKPQPQPQQKSAPTARPASLPQPSGPAAPSPAPKQVRAGRNSLSKLESLPSIDVHDGKKKEVKKQVESSDEELSADGSSSSNSDSSSDSDSGDDKPSKKKPRRSTLLAGMIGRK